MFNCTIKFKGKILIKSLLMLIVLVMFSTNVEASSTGSAICSVTPASESIAQNGELSFTVSSNVPSTASDSVLISAISFSSGLYPDYSSGSSIPVGSSSLSFKVRAENNAETGSKTFQVYCSKDNYVGGSAGGMPARILDFATVSLNVTGTNPSGGGSGGSSNSSNCSVPSVSLPPNSSTLVNFQLGNTSGLENISVSATSNNSNITVTPTFPEISIVNGFAYGWPEVLVRTGPNFSGGSYSVTSDTSGSPCTATGNVTLPVVNNASGKLKLTAVKTLNPILFPDSGCMEANMYGTGSGAGCRRGFYGGSGPKIMDYGDSQVLVGGDVMRSNYSQITPASFSLADPMNPVFLKSGVVTVSSDGPGEHGMTYAREVAISKDGKVSAVTTNYKVLAIRTPSKIKTIIQNSSGGTLIVKYNSSYILFSDQGGVKNITNPDIEAPLPDGFPSLGQGYKIILGDGSYIAVSASGSSDDITLFSINESEPIARLSMPAGHEKISFGKDSAIKIPFSGGDYIFTKGMSGVNLFKFEYTAKKITWVIKDASYADYDSKYGRFFDAKLTGFDAGNGNIGVIAFNSTGPHAFLLSDIASGKWIDILVSSPNSTIYQRFNLTGIENGPIGSFSRNGITYVYSSNSNGENVNVWKFEINNGSGGSNTGGNTGGTPYYPTTPTVNEDPNCPGGTVYQTSAGPLCVNSSGGVTTTTSYNFGPSTTVTGGTKSPTSTKYNLGNVTLKKGSTGEAVKELQRFLNNKLNLGLVVDGKLGPKTVAVVKEWQSDNGLVVDGLVGPRTKEAMNASAD